MLNAIRRQIAALGMVVLAACTPLPEMHQALDVEASYRLLFNDALVGNALFVLQLQHDGSYRIDAFTTPAGKMQQAAGHEVLESSSGVIDSDGIRPQRFEHSVMQGERMEMVELMFDWDSRTLRLTGAKGEHTTGLQPRTQDRLSYLLAARRLAMAGEGETQMQIVSAEATDDTRLEVIGRQSIVVPLGRYQAVAIKRVSTASKHSRGLWFDTDFSPLPLRVLHSWDANTVEMQLETFSQRPSDPH